jgi:adenylate cyclase
MDRVYQWIWERHGPRFSWVGWLIGIAVSIPVFALWSYLILAVERSNSYLAAAAITLVAVAVLSYAIILPGHGESRVIEQWAAGKDIDRAEVLSATYAWVRGSIVRALAASAVIVAAQSVGVGVVAGVYGWRLVQYGILGAVCGVALQLIAVHNFEEAVVRTVRAAVAGDTGIGDDLPRSRPTFAAWLTMTLLGAVFVFALNGAMLSTIFSRFSGSPMLYLAIGCTLTFVFALPLTVGLIVAPALRPIQELAAATKRVAAGDFSQRLPVVQDDDLGALAGSFNRMQAGLAERQRLQSAFGTYVDPGLATRLLAQGDDVFTGERREVTVMFVDIRDFTPFAEANTAEDTVARLNALFEIVVPAVVDTGGHVNKFLGDGALAVFGAPNDLADHADAAVAAAIRIHELVTERFRDELRIGIGINTGIVIAGTIGGAGKLEFTLIGDTVNVAARVEQLTKTTGDTILLTGQTVDALADRPAGLIDRGSHALKGKSAPAQIFGLRSVDPDDRVTRY